MKKRLDFVTNSSSTIYVVTNLTNQTKNALDLLREAAEGEWYYVSWPYYNLGSDYTKGAPDLADPKPFASVQEFEDEVRKIWTFPPRKPVAIEIAWGDGEPIYLPRGYLRSRSRSFKIHCPPQ